MAATNYGREQPTPPHVTAHDNPSPSVSPLHFPNGYRPTLREVEDRMYADLPGGDRPGELDGIAAAYDKQYGRYPNRGRGLDYTSGPGVSKARRAAQKNK